MKIMTNIGMNIARGRNKLLQKARVNKEDKERVTARQAKERRRGQDQRATKGKKEVIKASFDLFCAKAGRFARFFCCDCNPELFDNTIKCYLTSSGRTQKQMVYISLLGITDITLPSPR